ncbi:TIGR04282 family arsenosugar biosynthesis glycosyltransferase [Marinobacter salexigens]|uniref:TIGR04282 family arsenosugar biosynthesis glycosyltransferase n=1 Tax=Marinobacter salexigens TaxID=1925763 RepID=A0ABS6A9S6_9GAMM|nr:TIGR04282 family arsenosugar biosynthesis glycosyltransferase [Marinobacter salexigens]MBU2874509.1 TIGR04282 family arsenosugar biosynthesis glycosyltransferase [Marinobacter salexigens]
MAKNKSADAVVMQFAKWPEAGRVKTRLIPALGVSGALRAHVALTFAVLENLDDSGFAVQFWWDRELEPVPEVAQEVVQAIEQRGVEQRVQQGMNLGDRMFNALAVGLASHRLALIVGSDCPSVDPGYVRQAVGCLEDYDVVLGPSDDGGYVLIGARRVVPHMLDGVEWGTGSALEQTCEQIKKMGLSVGLLEPRWDVDEPEDWARFQLTLK